MGKFLSTLKEATQTLHDIVDDKPYLKRYKTDDLTLNDHLRHLHQLTFIYEVIERKIKQIAFLRDLHQQLPELNERQPRIALDLFILKEAIYQGNQDSVVAKKCDATAKYVEYLENLDVSNERNAKILLGHFLTRILGDLFGGQKIKDHLIKLYAKNQKLIYGVWEDENTGLQFYSFSEGALKNLLLWLQKNIPDEWMDTIITGSKEAFVSHVGIFDELEEIRKKEFISFVQHKQNHEDKLMQSVSSITNNVISFFSDANNRRKAAVAAGCVVAAATGVIVSKMM
jgi:heme oxygenase